MKDENRNGFLRNAGSLTVSSRAIRQEFRVRVLIGVSRFAEQVPSSSGQDVPLTWGRSVVRVHPGPLDFLVDRLRKGNPIGDGARLESG